MWHFALAAANDVVILILVECYHVFLKVEVIINIPESFWLFRPLIWVYVVSQEVLELDVHVAVRLVLVHRQVTVARSAMELMRFLISIVDRVLLPLARFLVTMSTATALAVDWTGSAGSLSLFKRFLHGHTLEQLHVQMPRENKADLIGNLRHGVDADDDGYAAVRKDVCDFLRITRRNEG